MERVDIVRDRDQRRLAASRYWQHLQVQQGGCPMDFVVLGVVPEPMFCIISVEPYTLSWKLRETCRLHEKRSARPWRLDGRNRHSRTPLAHRKL